MFPRTLHRLRASALLLSAWMVLWSCATQPEDAPATEQSAATAPGTPDRPGEPDQPGEPGFPSDATASAADEFPETENNTVPRQLPADPLSPQDHAALLRRAAQAVLATDPTAVPVTVGSDGFLGAVADIDADGRHETALLLVGTAFADLARAEVLADASRLFRTDARTPDLYLAVFTDVDGRPEELYRFSLGRRRVVTAVAVVPLSVHSDGPTAFRVMVTTRAGNEEYWCGFAASGTASVAVIENAGATRTVIVDIDGNGMRDIIQSQQIMEQGRVFETLITWTRWGERGFESVATTNVVRNLSRFLDAARLHAIAGDLSAFAGHVLPSRMRADVNTASIDDMVDSLFFADPEETPPPPSRLMRERVIRDMMFPVVTRNPFPEIGRESVVRTGVRLVTADDDLFFHVDLAMAANPFSSQPFFFRPVTRGQPPSDNSAPVQDSIPRRE